MSHYCFGTDGGVTGSYPVPSTHTLKTKTSSQEVLGVRRSDDVTVSR